jgi:outer membrane receptor protein involved in Fe transport
VYDESNETDFSAYGLDVGYDFGAFSISSATSYVDYSNGGDLSGILFTGIDSRVLAQEVLLSSTDQGAWQWSLGAFYRDAEDAWFQDLYGPLEGFPGVQFKDTSESYALFGEFSRRFFHDQLKWTLGLRYFHDEGTTEGFELDPGSFYSATYEATTPRAVLTWTPNNDLSVYGSYSEGFRSGAYQYETITRLAPFYPPVEPDTLHNYEIGAKGSFLNQRVSFEAAVFYIDWRDVQQVLNIIVGTLPNGEPIGTNVAINGASASGFGADLSLTVRPAQGLELGASLSWNDLTMDEALFNQDPNGPVRVFAAGDRLVFSPEYTASGFADYAFPIGSGFEGRLSGSINYTSSQDAFGGTTRFFGDDIAIARASFSLEAADHWTAMLYVDNLNNEYDTVVPQFGVPDWSSRVRPRTVGLQFEYRYGRR